MADAKEPVTPTKTDAAKWAGIAEKNILDFRADADRFVVVTVAGEKVTQSDAERKAAAKTAKDGK